MFTKKEIKYGYTTGDGRVAKPSNLTNIRLTPRNNKFIFYGTRHDILKWMNSHSELLVEYEPTDQDYEISFSPLSSPLFPSYSDIPESPLSPTSITSSLSTNSTDSTDSTSSNKNITFDLFAVPIKTTGTLSEDSSFSKPLNIALKIIPWIEVTLEIRPTNESKDSKLFPIHRVILPSGSSLFEVSKALEKSWKSPIPDQTAFSPDCFVRNNEILYPQKKPESDSDIEKRSNKFKFGIPTIDLFRQKQNTDDIPPGILTPYIIEDVLGELDDEKDEEFVNEQIRLDKKKEAESEKELPIDSLPKYASSFGDVLLESGRVYNNYI